MIVSMAMNETELSNLIQKLCCIISLSYSPSKNYCGYINNIILLFEIPPF